ncbi:hypothetical protein [Roseiconus lacunae]|uniref:Phage head-tail joining protein domain-containing protein n=1 Tax=Roseiconus lacunae TaxID=2605694 RepID=A0ABT7PEP1_9BACT|nr:hypothetical protein [Roseiconus lacunae]MDM4014970.1 hypothetical protein [Roseiconus lacunae]
MSLFDDVLSIHADVMESAAGEPVVYRFGSISITIKDAVRGESRFDLIRSDGGAYTETRTIDWIVRCDVMAEPNSGELIEPSVGAEFTDASGSVYEVIPGLSPTGWRWSDTRRNAYRIHTMLRNRA